MVADEFFTQAQAEMRTQEMRAKVRRYSGVALGAVLVVAMGAGIWQWRLHVEREHAAEASGRYFSTMQTLQAPNGDAAAKAATRESGEKTLADLAANAPGDIRAFAGLRLAQLRMEAKDRDGAVRAWQGVRDDAKAEPSLRALARLLILNATDESASPEALRKGYQELASSNGPWRALAQEGLVSLDMRKGATPAQQEEARRLLTGISQSPDAPDGARQRANALLQTFGGAG